MRDFDELELEHLDPTAPVGALSFVHKRIGGAIKGFVASGGNPIAAVGGFVQGGGRPGPSPQLQAAALPNKWPFTATVAELQGSIAANTAGAPAARAELMRRGVMPGGGSALVGGGGHSGGGCRPPSFRVGTQCVDPTAALPGGRPFVSPAGGVTVGGPPMTPVLGFYGVAVQPAAMTVTRHRCPPGFVLGKDNLCYDHLPKSKRKWNPGRKPLLTGGELNAISTAERAAKKLQRQRKKLKALATGFGK